MTAMKQLRMREFPTIGGSKNRGDKRTAIILAGGEGTRLRSLTKLVSGDDRPKQFCPIFRDKTLLDATRQRIALRISPENTFFSLTQKHERYYRGPLWNVPEANRVIQPENRGTAPAILFALLRVAEASPDSTVAIFPSDHYFSDDEAFMRNIDRAFTAAELNANSVVLLGIEPEKAETSYGWIEPANSLFGELTGSVSRVARFWEKPSQSVARSLMATGCMWNSFVMVGKVSAFINLIERHLPDLFRMFKAYSAERGKQNETATLRSIYAWISEINFSHEVLEHSADDLLVMRVADVGWSDWGEPERVVGTLAGLGIRPEWTKAIAA